MARRSRQKGSLNFKNGFWSGRYLERTLGSKGQSKTTNRRVYLGTLEELPTEEDARRKLEPMVDAANFRYSGQMAKANQNVSVSDIGAAAELLVSADLIHQGYDVFRNLSPNGPIDLIAWKEGEFTTVQVKQRKNARYLLNIQTPCNVVALVNSAGKIFYVPSPQFHQANDIGPTNLNEMNN